MPLPFSIKEKSNDKKNYFFYATSTSHPLHNFSIKVVVRQERKSKQRKRKEKLKEKQNGSNQRKRNGHYLLGIRI